MLQEKVAAPPPPALIEELKQALEYQKKGDMDAADKIYKDALKKGGDHPDIALLAAIFYHQIGRNKYAIRLLERLLKSSPSHLKAHRLLGKAFLEDKQYDAALKSLQQASRLAPQDSETHYHTGCCLHATGRIEQALTSLLEALTHASTLGALYKTDIYNRIGELYIAVGRKDKAREYLNKALKDNLADSDTLVRLAIAEGEETLACFQLMVTAINQAPQRDEAKALMSHCCETGGTPSLVNDRTKTAILHCLKSPNVNPQGLAALWSNNFFQHPDNQDAARLLAVQDYEQFREKFADIALRSRFYSPYFTEGLKKIIPNTLSLETMLTFLRRYYLSGFLAGAVAGPGGSPGDAPLIAAMAQQCFLNEYIFALTDEEAGEIEKLKQEIEGKTGSKTGGKTKRKAEGASFDDADEIKILLYACYAPLLNLENSDKLLKLKDRSTLRETLALHLEEPLEEQALKKTIRALGRINNAVSRTVRAQYEENPYPRWTSANVFHPFHARSIDPEYKRKTAILIAGCGTGKQIMNAYNTYNNPDITAVDLSLSSLAYTKRKLHDYGLDKTTALYQADILELEQLGRTFDAVECCGVLHHMESPLAGLKTLTALLKKGGNMKLGLYSALARRSIFDVRKAIEAQGFVATPKGIRDCRAYILASNQSGKIRYPLYKWRDFFSMSECRDLMFHVQETCYSIEEIQDLLDQAGLAFSHFELPAAKISLFQKLFPAPESLSDLECWRVYEKKNPDTFSAMYQFVVQKL